MIKAVFILILSVSLSSAQFLENSSKLSVSDLKSKKMWQDNDLSAETKFTYKEGIAYCSTLGIEGKSDWRLPLQNEYHVIIDHTRIPSILPIFSHTASGCYWTKDVDSKGDPIFIDFTDGYAKINSKSAVECYVRCIRDSQ